MTTLWPTIRQAARIPVIGPWIGRTSQVADILATPCSVSPEVWVEAAWFGASKLFQAYSKPFLVADQWHRFRRKHRRKLRTIWDITEEIDGVYDIPPGVAWEVFALTADIALKLEWYFLLIDAATKGAVIWTSLAYQWSGCKYPGSAWAAATVDEGPIDLLPPGQTFVDVWHATGAYLFANGPIEIVCPNGYYASAGYSLRTGHNPYWPTIPDAVYTTQLVDRAQQMGAPEQVPTGDMITGVSSFMHQGDLWDIGFKDFAVELFKSYGIVWAIGGTFTATGEPETLKQLLFDP